MSRRGAAMSFGHYLLIAHIIRSIPDENARKIAADHFATEFNKRSKSFDPFQWEKATGGKPAPGSAA